MWCAKNNLKDGFVGVVIEELRGLKGVSEGWKGSPRSGGGLRGLEGRGSLRGMEGESLRAGGVSEGWRESQRDGGGL